MLKQQRNCILNELPDEEVELRNAIRDPTIIYELVSLRH